MLVNRTRRETLLTRVYCCDTFWRRLRGVMFRRPLADDEGYLFVESRASIAATAIHMFFVSFPIAVIWLDDDRRVVDKVLARPWRPYYAPRRPARYYLEAAPGLLERVTIGDELGW